MNVSSPIDICECMIWLIYTAQMCSYPLATTGASTDGLLHVSEISNEFIKDANDKLTAGETVTCRIKSINLEKNQLALTAKEPEPERQQRERKKRVDLSKYENFDPKEFTTGTVNSITECEHCNMHHMRALQHAPYTVPAKGDERGNYTYSLVIPFAWQMVRLSLWRRASMGCSTSQPLKREV